MQTISPLTRSRPKCSLRQERRLRLVLCFCSCQSPSPKISRPVLCTTSCTGLSHLELGFECKVNPASGTAQSPDQNSAAARHASYGVVPTTGQVRLRCTRPSLSRRSAVNLCGIFSILKRTERTHYQPTGGPYNNAALTGYQGLDSPASASCSASGMSRRLSIPKAPRKVSVVTKV